MKIHTKELMSILKPVSTCGFMKMCANYANDINEQFAEGVEIYEISGLKTKSGQPHTFFNF